MRSVATSAATHVHLQSPGIVFPALDFHGPASRRADSVPFLQPLQRPRFSPGIHSGVLDCFTGKLRRPPYSQPTPDGKNKPRPRDTSLPQPFPLADEKTATTS